MFSTTYYNKTAVYAVAAAFGIGFESHETRIPESSTISEEAQEVVANAAISTLYKVPHYVGD